MVFDRNFQDEVIKRNSGTYKVGVGTKSNVKSLENLYFVGGKPVRMTADEYNAVRYGLGVGTKVRSQVLEQLQVKTETPKYEAPSKMRGGVVPSELEAIKAGKYRGGLLPRFMQETGNYRSTPYIPSPVTPGKEFSISQPLDYREPKVEELNPGKLKTKKQETFVSNAVPKNNPKFRENPYKDSGYEGDYRSRLPYGYRDKIIGEMSQPPSKYRQLRPSSSTGTGSTQADRPFKQIDRIGSGGGTGRYTGQSTSGIQRFGAPLVRGAGTASGVADLAIQWKLFSDALNSLDRSRKAQKDLGVTQQERERLYRDYGNPEYVYGLPRDVAKTSGSRPFDNSDPNFIRQAVQAMRRGESPEAFKNRYFGPQDKDGAEKYTWDYRNGPIFAPRPAAYGGLIPGDDGYTRWQREGLRNAARRSADNFYRELDRELAGDKLRNLLANLYNLLKRSQKLLDREAFNKQFDKEGYLDKGRDQKYKKYWDDVDKYGPEPDLQRQQKRIPSEWDDPPIPVKDPFESARDRDLRNLIEYLKNNPYRETLEDKLRRKQLEKWLSQDPSKVTSGHDPFKPAPIHDPSNPPDPNYPPLPPGLKYPILGWEIEAMSQLNETGVYVWWAASYIKNHDFEGDMPIPTVGTNGYASWIENIGGWQSGRVGFRLLPNNDFARPPAYVGGDESEIFSEEHYIEKWGILWTWEYNSPIWWETGNQDKENEVFRDKRRLESRGKSNIVPGTTTIIKAVPIRGRQPEPDNRPQPPSKPEPEDPIMPGCSYQPDRQNSAIVSFWDKLTGRIAKKPIQVHEGVDEGFEHVSQQIAQLNEQIDKISKVLDVDKYTAPQGKVVAPVLGMEAVTTILGSSDPRVPIPSIRTLPQENMVFSAVNYMFSGHHLLGKLQLPVDPTKGADEFGNLDRMTPRTSMGYLHKFYNDMAALIGIPNRYSVVDKNGVKTPQAFKNSTDAIENTHANTVAIEQDVSSLQEALIQALKNQEAMLTMIHKIGYQVQFLMDDSGARVKNITVERPTGVKMQAKPKDNVQTGSPAPNFSWDNLFKNSKAYTTVPTWDKSNELDKLQLGLKTNIEAQKAAASNFYPIAAKGNQNSLPRFGRNGNDTWKQFVKTINDATDGGLYTAGTADAKIEEIKYGVSSEIATGDVKFIGDTANG